MYKDARFYISVSVDVTVPLASGYASVYKLSVVLEIYRKELFASCKSSYLPYLVIHISSLLRTQKKIGAGINTYRHIVEIPGENAALIYEHIQKIIAGDGQIILTGITYRDPERNMVFVHEIHSS